jgi:hypothetical protein
MDDCQMRRPNDALANSIERFLIALDPNWVAGSALVMAEDSDSPEELLISRQVERRN